MPKKDISVSEKCRKNGNQEFKQKNYGPAVKIYGESISAAPKNSKPLALSFGNRSAVLWELKLYEECLRDIERALSNEFCPEDVKEKLKKRREKCNNGIKERKGEFQKKKQKYLPPTIIECNSQIPSVSSFCDLKYEENRGRYFVASDEIKPGTILIVENPYAFVILPHCADEFCHHCCELMPPDFVPCEYCSDVKFCSEICRDAATMTYHRLECGELKILYDSGLAHLALRNFSFTDVEDLCELFCEHRRSEKFPLNVDSRYGLDKSRTYFCNYETVYNLVTNSHRVFPEDLKVYEQASRQLVKFLENSRNFFDEFIPKLIAIGKICETCKEKNIVRKNLERILLRHIEQMICNANTVTCVRLVANERTYDDGVCAVDSNHQEKIASAVYLWSSLMNHSCDPNTFSSFIGKTIVVRATKEIKRGEEIFNCYGPRFGRMSFENRQQSLLQQYFFVCNCCACSSKSALQKEFLFTAMACDQCCGPLLASGNNSEFICKDCLKQFPASRSEKIEILLKKFDERLTDAVSERNFMKMKEELKSLEAFLYKFNKHLLECRDLVAQQFLVNGDFKTAAVLLLKNLDGNEFVFGSNSIEVANEILKIVDFLIADINFTMDETLRKKISALATKAIEIFSIHYGLKCLQIEEIQSALSVQHI